MCDVGRSFVARHPPSAVPPRRGQKAAREGRSRYWSEPSAYPFESDEHYEGRAGAFDQGYDDQFQRNMAEINRTAPPFKQRPCLPRGLATSGDKAAPAKFENISPAFEAAPSEVRL